jgi:hypothetical protein
MKHRSYKTKISSGRFAGGHVWKTRRWKKVSGVPTREDARKSNASGKEELKDVKH